jgi:hypothetical protein
MTKIILLCGSLAFNYLTNLKTVKCSDSKMIGNLNPSELNLNQTIDSSQYVIGYGVINSNQTSSEIQPKINIIQKNEFFSKISGAISIGYFVISSYFAYNKSKNFENKCKFYKDDEQRRISTKYVIDSKSHLNSDANTENEGGESEEEEEDEDEAILQKKEEREEKIKKLNEEMKKAEKLKKIIDDGHKGR